MASSTRTTAATKENRGKKRAAANLRKNEDNDPRPQLCWYYCHHNHVQPSSQRACSDNNTLHPSHLGVASRVGALVDVEHLHLPGLGYRAVTFQQTVLEDIPHGELARVLQVGA